MATTTIRLSEELKARGSRSAPARRPTASSSKPSPRRPSGKNGAAISIAIAERRFAEIIASGKTVPWSEMRRYLEDRVAGKKGVRPVARKLAR